MNIAGIRVHGCTRHPFSLCIPTSCSGHRTILSEPVHVLHPCFWSRTTQSDNLIFFFGYSETPLSTLKSISSKSLLGTSGTSGTSTSRFWDLDVTQESQMIKNQVWILISMSISTSTSRYSRSTSIYEYICTVSISLSPCIYIYSLYLYDCGSHRYFHGEHMVKTYSALSSPQYP